MCGIALFVSKQSPDEARASVGAMLRAIAHRGPDDEGLWRDEGAGVTLGHRRLSIIDTSARGHQPMVSGRGRYVIAFNGEIYNYVEMRAELEAAVNERRAAASDSDASSNELGAWQSDSDTEVLLVAIETWGVARALEKAAGMFAFVLWDRKERRLVVARDRLGKKPLYYGWRDGGFAAASEISALRAVFPDLRVDPDAMTLLSRFGFIPEPYAAYEGVKKLLPGTYLEMGVPRPGEAERVEPTAYYRLEHVIRAGEAARARRWTPHEVVDLVDDRLSCAVRQRLRSDVPFGAFLSGGIDSSLVVALMQKHVPGKVRTFSLGFEEGAFDESKYAAEIAAHLGTEHRELIVRQSDVLDLVPDMARVYDEPFADSSQLPTTLVSRLAREHVTVVLTGDGGDEIFGGYNRHVWGKRVWGMLRHVPRGARTRAGRALLGIDAARWDDAAARVSPLLPPRFRVIQAGEKMRKLARLAGSTTPEALHLDLATLWLAREHVTRSERSPRTLAELGAPFLDSLTPLERALWFDTVQGLPGDMLVKVDRASMSVGLEARQPLLDHRLLEASWKIPSEFKIREGVGKWPLRELLARHVPRPLWERPKSGFSVPIDAWLRGPLRDWAEDLLAERNLEANGVFRAAAVRQAWHAHLGEQQNHGARLWTVLSAQAWMAETGSSVE